MEVSLEDPVDWDDAIDSKAKDIDQVATTASMVEPTLPTETAILLITV